MHRIAAFYRFADLPDPSALRAPLRALCEAAGVRGTILLAAEGVNGTIAGAPAGVDAVLAHLRALPGCAAMEAKLGEADAAPFARLKVRVRREIVTMGEPVDAARDAGIRIAPADWDALLAEPDVVAIDTRNGFEVAIGSFAGAIDPGLESFAGFPDWWRANEARLAGRRIAMFCTGGIRCEKSTAFLRSRGVEGVHHLDGGILRYLAEVPTGAGGWRGACYVFDGRVAVGPGLAPAGYESCHACGRPLSEADRAHPDHEPGVACAACLPDYTEADRTRFRERQRQADAQRMRRPSGPATKTSA